MIRMDMYDSFSTDYDRFVNWPSRLAYEMPFIEKQLAILGEGPLRILDAACGTGMHAIALARLGHSLAGADLSIPMIERARQNAAQAGVEARFEPVGFGALSRTFEAGSFDVLLCLGNSLPHVTRPEDLVGALQDFAAVLRPGGLLLVQSRNFDLVMAGRERWMEPQSHQEEDQEWLFLRFYDYLADGLIDFNIVTLHRQDSGPWRQQVTTTKLRPILQAELLQALAAAGFSQVASYGDMAGAEFNPSSSGNLVITAIKN